MMFWSTAGRAPGNLVAGVVLCFIPVAAYWSWRFGAAEQALRLATWESVQEAARLAPHASTPWLYQAQVNPNISPTALAAALARNPYNSRAAVQLALWNEVHGQTAAAEQILLAAAQHDRTHEVVWALANFYFRQDQDEPFWRYAKKAVQFEPERPEAVFELCWAKRPDPLWLLNNLVPDEPWALPRFADFLCQMNSGAAVLPVVRRVLDKPPFVVSDIVGIGEWLWLHGRADDAVAVWHMLQDRHLVPIGKPAVPEILNNARLTETYGRGFDWRINTAPGVMMAPSSAGLRMRAEDLASDSQNLIWQPVLLEPGRRYTLRWQWRRDRGSSDPVSPAGLHWYLAPVNPPRDQSAGGSPASPGFSDSEAEQVWNFTTASGGDGQYQLRLAYQRDPGMRAWEGTLYLDHVSLRPAGQPLP